MADSTDTTRRCSKCSNDLPLTAFAVDRSKHQGIKSWCKQCDNERSRSYYHNGGREVRSKRCPNCGETKFASCFYRSSASKDGLQGWCKVCARIAVDACWDKNRERYQAKYRKPRIYGQCQHCTAPVRRSAKWCDACRPLATRLQQYKLTIADFEQLKAKQHGRCAICERHPTDEFGLVVDHCHTTGVVRGLLCGSCNKALGMLGDTSHALARALEYVSKSTQLSIL
jgi:hypothetical protein